MVAHYLITGHTGFKGSWLSLLLKSRGHTVSGLALDPPIGGLFDRAGISSDMEHDLRVDVRDREEVIRAFKRVKPDFVIHMAAQALVREGYRDPLGTYETNVNGTLNILQASDQTDSITSQLIVTTDKVYRDDGRDRSHVESDPLGGNDPYSASKAAADIMAQEFLQNQRTKPGAIVRAGNVIGAGDTTRDRLVTDLVTAATTKSTLKVRFPDAVRPWQHVLDCLDGYLAVITKGLGLSHVAWNIGPNGAGLASVSSFLDYAKKILHDRFPLVEVEETAWFEAGHLSLDTSLALDKLGLAGRYGFEEAVKDSLSEALDYGGLTAREHVLAEISRFEATLSRTSPQVESPDSAGSR